MSGVIWDFSVSSSELIAFPPVKGLAELRIFVAEPVAFRARPGRRH
jgi:hypothetical protein